MTAWGRDESVAGGAAATGFIRPIVLKNSLRVLGGKNIAL